MSRERDALERAVYLLRTVDKDDEYAEVLEELLEKYS